MHTPHYSLLFAGILALIQFALTTMVIIRRAQTGVEFLDGGDASLLRRIRVHGNFTESAPMPLLLFALLEISGLAAWALVTLGVVLVLGRVCHASSLFTPHAAWMRRVGTLFTQFVLSVQAMLCLWMFLR